MSLTRDQWVAMWRSIKILERATLKIPGPTKQVAMKEVVAIKDQIQAVIGQME